uniref:Uncharacterized protein n=1 Tax=Kwoniella dejecticola CBS 10117 TaxID=1296121 RepID=A0A1A6AAD8_9TREE|nr:uncharacterized protein I303_03037 [Kwoniella dejecticola CBS 10117]OBR87015.1 hypothetical protein I303_03037 [Kwoniella dejecticola CBS 10117]
MSQRLQEIFKELSSKFQSKTSRRSSNKAKGENKDLKKVDKVHDDLLNTMGIDDQPAAAGHDRLEHPPEVAANFHDRLNTLIEQDDESASKLSDLIARRTTHWYTIYDAYIDLNDNYQKSIITDLDKAVTLFEKRPKNIESTIKDYTKLQRETMKEDEEKIKSMLDDKNLVHQWQIFMASMLKRP